MNATRICLQLWLPAALQDELGDALLDWRGGIGLFHLFEARALGHDLVLRTAQDKVRGSTAQVGAQVLLPADQLEALLAHLKGRPALTGLSWSATALLEAGSLT